MVVLINSAGKSLCYDILHEKEQIPPDGAQLYSKLEECKNKMNYPINKDILCPSSKVIDESKFDLMTYATVIHLMFGTKYSNFIDDVREMRNSIFHMKDKCICSGNFNQLWCDAWNMLQKYGFDTKLFINLSTCDLSSLKEYKGILDFLLF